MLTKDIFNNFKIRAEAASADVYHYGTKAEAMDFIVQIIRKEDVTDNPGSYAVWADSPFLNGIDRKDLVNKIPGLKFEVTRDLAKNAKIGITQANYGLANTGTLVQDQTAVEQRLASSLTRIHIAILATGNILPDMPSVMMKIHPNKTGYIAMITGPSRTADIERVLTIGVHGPERIIIVCIDEGLT